MDHSHHMMNPTTTTTDNPTMMGMGTNMTHNMNNKTHSMHGSGGGSHNTGSLHSMDMMMQVDFYFYLLFI